MNKSVDKSEKDARKLKKIIKQTNLIVEGLWDIEENKNLKVIYNVEEQDKFSSKIYLPTESAMVGDGVCYSWKFVDKLSQISDKHRISYKIVSENYSLYIYLWE